MSEQPRKPGRISLSESSYELLVRLDERGRAMENDLRELRTHMVTQNEFKPVRMIAFGLVSVTLVSVMGGLMALLFSKGP